MKRNILLTKNLFNNHCSYSFAVTILNSYNLIKETGNKIKIFYSLKKEIFDVNI